MSIEKIVLKMATHYHANLIDIHNALHALGLKSDEQAEEFNKKHMMKIVDMYTRRGYDITKVFQYRKSGIPMGTVMLIKQFLMRLQ